MNNSGKVILQKDDSSKIFQQRCLAGNEGKGIDVEGVYFAKKMDVHGQIVQPAEYQYYIFEYLKCESSLQSVNGFSYPKTAPPLLYKRDLCPTYFSPWKSDPNKYKWNWRKFYVLYKLALRLSPSQLVFVNYSDGFIKNNNTARVPAPLGYDDQVRLMYVEDIDVDVLKIIGNMPKDSMRSVPTDYIKFSQDAFYSFSEYADWFLKLNQTCILPPLYEVHTIFGDLNDSWRL